MSLLDHTWHHVCFTWGTIGGNISLYIDGLVIGQQQSVHPGLTFNSSGLMVIGQLQKAIGGAFYTNESFHGDITDVNIWRDELTPDIIAKQLQVCYSHMGDLVDWYAFKTGTGEFQNEATNIPAECLGFGEYHVINYKPFILLLN